MATPLPPAPSPEHAPVATDTGDAQLDLLRAEHEAKARKDARRVAYVGLAPLVVAAAGRLTGLLAMDHASVLAALTAACILGGIPGALLRHIAPIPGTPSGVDKTLWRRLVGRTDGGVWIGAGERLLIVGAVASQAPTLIVGWFAFKLASKWEVWKNVVQVPGDASPPSETSKSDWLVARHELGSWLLNRFWLGTLANLVLGLAAVYLGSLVGLIPRTF